MFYLASGAIFFAIQSYLTVTTNINIWPELFFIPWLINKGAIPFRDFFNHHGFLLYYLLSPFTNDKTLFSIKAAYVLILTLNLILVLFILKKITNKLGFLIGGFLYVLLIYFASENNFWDEIVITTFYLIIYYLVMTKKTKSKILISGALVALASFIKPQAAVIILPLFIIYQSIILIVPTLIMWLLVFGYFAFNNVLSGLISNLFLFNRFFPSYILKQPLRLYDKKFLSFSLLMMLFVLIVFKQKKRLLKNLPLISFVFLSGIFLFPMYEKTHLTPLITFLALFIGVASDSLKGKTKWFFLPLFLYSLFMISQVGRHYLYLNTQRIPYIENKRSLELTSWLKRNNLDKKRIYILGNQVEIYYFTDQLPPAYFPLVLPGFAQYFSNIQALIINGLIKNRVELILVPLPQEEYYKNFNLLKEFINDNYSLKKNIPGFNIYWLNK